MGQKLREDKIGALSHSGGTITMAASTSNAARLTIGGQQYKIVSNLTLAVGTATASTLYMIYATVSAGVVSLQKSTAVNSIGPGTSSWKLVGAFYTAAADTWGSFVSIEGAPTSEAAAYTPTTQGIGTPTSVLLYWSRVGKKLRVQGRLTTGTVAASEFRLGLPSGLTVGVFGNTIIAGRWHRNISGAATKTGSLNSTSGLTYVNAAHDDAANSSSPFSAVNGSTLYGSTEILSFEFEVPAAEWSSTPLKDL